MKDKNAAYVHKNLRKWTRLRDRRDIIGFVSFYFRYLGHSRTSIQYGLTD